MLLRRWVLLAVAAFACAGNDALGDLDGVAGAAMQEFRIPGLALAVVKDGRVIHARGYGFRDDAKKLPVTTQTIFGIGSITKSFTVLALATLVEEGKLDWDRPVREYVPDFRLHDPVATSLATPRDLVSHRTGLPRHDSMWFTGFDRAGIFGRLRYLEPSKDFRSTFQYNNLMYLAAGVASERVSGRSWEELVRERLWSPMSWKSATFAVGDAEKTGDWARNYGEKGTEIPPTRAVESICPAGCINANLDEMTRYLRLHLGRGMLEGAQILPARHFDAMRVPNVFVPSGAFGPEALGETAYGLGVDIASYRGHKLVFHTGTIGGYHALLAFLPDDNAGVVVLQNRVARAVPQLLSFSIWDRLLGLERKDWLAHFAADERKQKDKTEAAKKAAEEKRKPGTRLSHELPAYEGRYTHPAYGEVRVAQAGDGLELHFGPRQFKLKHFHYDVFEYGEQQQRLRFVTGFDGDVDQIAVKLEPAVREIVFDRQK